MNNNIVSDWKGFAVSIPGSGHIRREIPCQDASFVQLAGRPSAIVCDGRGSAALSHLGAQTAVKMFRTQLAILEPQAAELLDTNEPDEEAWKNFCRIMYRTLMQTKIDLSEELSVPEKEFDFTVAFAVTGKKSIGCFQVGDGAIVLRQNEKCLTAFMPEKGEFANQTYFLRNGGEAKGKFQSALFDADANSGIAVTSDGPEHVMFKLPEMIPGKVFDSMFNDLQHNEINRTDILDYLTSSNWNNDPRGSDDRSLALLCSIEKNIPKPSLEQSEKNTADTPVENPVSQEQKNCTEQVLEQPPHTEMLPGEDKKTDTVSVSDNCSTVVFPPTASVILSAALMLAVYLYTEKNQTELLMQKITQLENTISEFHCCP